MIWKLFSSWTDTSRIVYVNYYWFSLSSPYNNWHSDALSSRVILISNSILHSYVSVTWKSLLPNANFNHEDIASMSTVANDREILLKLVTQSICASAIPSMKIRILLARSATWLLTCRMYTWSHRIFLDVIYARISNSRIRSARLSILGRLPSTFTKLSIRLTCEDTSSGKILRAIKSYLFA